MKKKYFFIGFLILIIAYLSYRLLFISHLPRDYSSDNIEESRLLAPNSLIEAVVMRNESGGATDSYIYQVYLVNKGEKPEARVQRFVATKLEGFNLLWRNSSILEIHYSNANILEFKNHWYTNIGDKEDLISVELILVNNNFQ